MFNYEKYIFDILNIQSFTHDEFLLKYRHVKGPSKKPYKIINNQILVLL